MLSNLLKKLKDTVESIFTKYGLYGSEDGGDIEELILLTHPACPHCKSLKESIYPLLENGQIREVSIRSEEGKRIAKATGTRDVPTLIAKVNNSYVVCDYWLDNGNFVFKLNDSIYSLPIEGESGIEEVDMSIRELLVLTKSDCHECARLRQAIKDGIEQGIFKLVYVDLDDLGQKLAEALGIKKLPQIVAVLDDGTYVLCDYKYEDEGISFELTNVYVTEDELFNPLSKIETISEDYPEGTLAISCMDSYLKNSLANILLGKYEERGGSVNDEWYQLNVVLPLLSIPECPETEIGFGKVKKPKKKRKKSKRRTKKLKNIGIVALCKEAKELLAEYDKRVLELKDTDLIEFAPVEGVKKLTPYQEFMKKCMAEHKDLPSRERVSLCAKKWRESKSVD